MPKIGAHSHVRHKYLHDVAVFFFYLGGGGGEERPNFDLKNKFSTYIKAFSWKKWPKFARFRREK
jgi:hypothetical protein